MPETKFQDTVISEIGELKKVVVDMKQEIDFIKERFRFKKRMCRTFSKILAVAFTWSLLIVSIPLHSSTGVSTGVSIFIPSRMYWWVRPGAAFLHNGNQLSLNHSRRISGRFIDANTCFSVSPWNAVSLGYFARLKRLERQQWVGLRPARRQKHEGERQRRQSRRLIKRQRHVLRSA